MKKLIALLLAFVPLLTSGTPSLAHAHLDHASPPVGATVGASPGQITLSFSQSLEAAFSGAEVRNGNGARVDTGSSVSGTVIHVSVGALPPGTYKVNWHVLSVDTHKTQGSYSFTVGH